MNYAHIHLILNHLPLLTLPMATIFLTYGIYKGDGKLQRFSLMVLVATALTVIPVYLTGEPAEEIVEHLPGISKKIIHAHEESAELSLIFTLIAGSTALITLLLPKKTPIKELGPKIVVLTSFVSIGFLGYTAFLGGQIHHPEVSDSLSSASNLKPTQDLKVKNGNKSD